jgi:hypothetical protein
LIMVGGKVGVPSGSGATSGSFDNSLDDRAARARFTLDNATYGASS